MAAIAVVLTHGLAYPLNGNAPGLAHLLGRYGVTLFFVISGFIMVMATGTGRFAPLRFMLHRIRRVVPLYWLVCFAMAAFALVSPSVLRSTVLDLNRFVLSLFFVPTFDPRGTGFIFPFVKLGWTLNYEMFFYVLFALAFWLSAIQRAIVLTVALGGLAILGSVFAFETAPAIFYTRVDTIGFVVGIWLGIARQRNAVPQRPVTLAWLFAGSVVSLAGITLLYEQIRDENWCQLWLIATCVIQVGVFAGAPSRPWRVPAWLTFAGDASYSIYLTHLFGVGFAVAVFRRIPAAPLAVEMIVASLFGLLAGLTSYVLIEAPLNRRIRSGRLRASPGVRYTPEASA